jgi:hypothetical protein
MTGWLPFSVAAGHTDKAACLRSLLLTICSPSPSSLFDAGSE